MSSRKSSWLLAIACLVFTTNVGCAQNPVRGFSNWFGKVKSQFTLDKQRNNAHPQPFVAQDQAALHDIFSNMYAQGAGLSRVLDAVHFDEKTNRLNNAGIARLREILNQQKDLDILVASSLDPKTDKARESQIRDLLAQYTFPGKKPKVSGTFFLPHHNVASEKATLRETFLSNQPAPSLQSVAGDISGSAQ